MNFTDTDLMMLEQLTYVSGDACKLAEVTATQVPGETVGDRLSVFTEDALQKLEESGAEGQQWAAIIRYIQGNEDMCRLVQGEQFKDENGTTLATAYYYGPPKSGDSIVTFHGTSTAEHWYDNATGLGTSDTEAQKKALEYINSLPYDNITVVGHSKGGNLSQYVTITCDKVNRCVSMDGQGFSQEFIDKYWAEINLKGDKITNYSLSTDFVHILLYPIPNSKQDYCTGDRVDSVVENHYSNSFFQYETTYVDGKPVTVFKMEDGQPVIYNNQLENEMMAYLHEFTCFVLATMPADERVEMGDYVGNILKLAMTGTPVDGYTNVVDYLMSDEEKLSKFIAYLIKYLETYNLSEEDLRSLMSMLGLNDIVTAIDEFYAENKGLCDVAIGVGEGLLAFLLKQLGDGKEDKIIEALLEKLQDYLADEKGIELPISIKETWQNVEAEYIAIPDPPANANQNVQVRQGKEYQYTRAVYNALMSTFNSFSRMDSVNISQWSGYSNQTWYTKLFIGTFILGINKYNRKLADIVSAAKNKTDEAFQAVSEVDRTCAQKVGEQVSAVNVLVLASR
ncbi:MAG: Mbeg1-like protein [Faecousia sp.]